jgi:Rieske Fe-S protein
MAPVCEHCGCRIIGHGVQAGGRFFCCAHCASIAEDRGEALADRA